MRVIACGDALFSSRNLANRIDPRLIAEFRAARGVFANAEFCCPQPETAPMPRRFQTAVPERALDELMSIGINMVGFANNHTGDFGPPGVLDTIAAAERRDLLCAGIGRSLEQARAAKFLDTAEGRIGVVAAGTTRAGEFLASRAGNGVVPRAGLNPLRWGRTYVLPDAEYRKLQEIDALLGTAQSRQEVMRVEIMPDTGPDKFAFGSVFEGAVPIERGETAHVRYHADQRDVKALVAAVRDAARRSECVIFSLHCHEGTQENWYSSRPASFIEDLAHDVIEAGATAFIGHGPHMLRGIDFHLGRPIFYSLNSLLMEFESGEHKMTPEMYESYGFGPDALPSDLHGFRARDASGTPVGFHSHPKFTHACAAIIDTATPGAGIQLIPIDLGMGADRPTVRGLPQWATPTVAADIAAELTQYSEPYGTSVSYEADSGMLVAAPR